MSMNEFQLIDRFFRSRGTGPGVVAGPGDDAALLAPTVGMELAMTMDTLIEGRHFPAELPAADVGWRSLAVNLSDLAAMGAEPRWCLLSLSLPEADAAWLADFCAGFYALAEQAGVALVGGDLTRGPLQITVQATGEVPAGMALRRGGARAGDRVCIGGVPGEAAAGLACWQAGERGGALIDRLARPQPQIALGLALRGRASACIDVSDGVLADLGHIVGESGVGGAVVEASRLPLSDALALWGDVDARLDAQLAGGDDYLLLFTLPPGQALPPGCHEIGRITDAGGVRVVDGDGRELPVAHRGWKHF